MTDESGAAEDVLTTAHAAPSAGTSAESSAAPAPLLTAALAQLAEGVIVTDASGRITYVNESAARLHGVRRLDVPPEQYTQTYHLLTEDGDVHPPSELPLARAVLRGETVLDARWRIRRPDGTEILAVGSARPVLTADGQQLGAVLTLHDETAREAAATAVREAAAAAEAGERQARFLADLGQALQPLSEADDIMAVTARRLGEHLAVDRCAYAEVEADQDHFTITGNYTRGDTASILGRYAFGAFGAECLRLMRADAAYVVVDAAADARVTASARTAYEHAQIRAVICLPLHKAGRFVAAMAVHQRGPRHWTDAEVELVVTVVQRCWESLERAAALRRLRDQEAALRAASRQLQERTAAAEAARHAAEEANAAKTQFLTIMSHELRTPLNAIGGYAELLELGLRGPLTDAQRADLGRLRRANQYLTALVTDVLNFTRLETGAVVLHVESLEIGAIIADLEAMIGPQCVAKGVTFDHGGCAPDTPDQLHQVYADGEKLQQVLLNLLTNALKFTNRGGRIALVCTTDTAAGVIRFEVRDTGRGIAAEHLLRIFDPFVQVERERLGESQQGLGLGLAISRELARAMGGDLTVESTVSVGSIFTLTLPSAAGG